MDERLIYRYFEGRSSAGEDRQLCCWLRESEENRREFSEMKAVWNAGNSLGSSCSDKAFSELMAGVDAKIQAGERKMKFRKAIRWSLSAAAAVILIVTGIPALRTLFGFGTYRVYENQEDRIARVILEDSTCVLLKSGSTLSIPRKFSGKARNVSLEGSACFNVKHDENAPFIVNAGKDLQVKVLGTTFCVDAEDGATGATVILEKGSVMLQSGEGKTLATLVPGQRAVYDNATGSLDISGVNASGIVMAQYDLVSLKNASMNDILEDVSRTFGTKLSCTDSLPGKKYSFNYLRSNTLEEVLRIIKYMTGEDVLPVSD